MQLTKEEYFFYEWLIIGKGMNQDTFSDLSPDEVTKLRSEWKAWFDKH